MNVSPTVTDVSRAIARVDVNASAGVDDIPPTDSANGLSMAALLMAAASNIAYQLSRSGISNVSGLPLSATVAILSSHGMSAFGIEQWATEIHGYIVSDFANSPGMSGRRLDTVASDCVVRDDTEE